MSKVEKDSYSAYDPGAATGVLSDELRRLQDQVRLTGSKEITLLRQSGLEDGQTITDVGCGPGDFGLLLLEEFPGSTVQGIEIDAKFCELASAAWQPHNLRSSIKCGSVYQPDDAFAASSDVVIARYVFQHLQYPERAAVAMRDMLVPDGLVAIIDIDEGLWGCVEPQQALFERLYRKAGGLQASRGGDRLIGRKLKHIMSRAGFEQPQIQVFAVHSDDVGLAAMDFHLNPTRLLPAVTAGLLSLEEYGVAQIAYQEFMSNPNAYAIVLGFICTANKPR